MPYLPPIQYAQIGPVTGLTGSTVQGSALLCPLMPRHFVSLPSDTVKQKIRDAIALGRRLGAKIVGLGGLTSVCCDEGREVADCGVAITSGNTLTAALAIKGIMQAADLLNLDLKNARLAVIGATGDIGSAVTRVLAPKVEETIIAARNQDRLNEFADELSGGGASRISIVKFPREAVQGADIIFSATSAVTTVLDATSLLPGAIVCDVAIPHDISREVRTLRDDILVFDGGVATFTPLESLANNSRWNSLFPNPTQIYGCLAETMVLALDGRYENFSIGRGGITENRISEMWDIAVKHGFSLGDFHCGETMYSQTEIGKIRGHLRSRRKNLCW